MGLIAGRACIKIYFQNVPDANRVKINGRPALSFWSLAPLFVSNANGNASKMITYLRAQCQATFGFNPYIEVPIEWIQNDPTSNNPNIVDAVRPWFVPVVGSGAYSSWNTYTWNGVTLGCAVPGYHGNGANDFSLWIDPNHGATLSTGLQNTVQASSMTFVEGIDDMWEAATCWRARNLDSNGNPLTYEQMGWQDYPNQRLNILRKYSNRPFPTDLKMEAEGCDTFGGAVGGGFQNNYYRNGPVSIYPASDTFGGHYVGNIQAGQWLEWQQVPLQGTFHINVRVATPNANCQLHFVIDGTSYPAVTLPNTGGLGNWQTVDTGGYTLPNNSYHTVRLVCDTAGFNVNFWQLGAGVVTPTPPPTPSGLSVTAGSVQVALRWLSSSGATGYNLKRSTNSGAGFTTIAGNLSATNYTDLAVTNDITYYYRVSATNSYGESTNSAFVSATPHFGWSLKQAPVMTQWASQVNPTNTLPEYPRPQLARSDWLNLNGVWQYQSGAAGDPVPVGQALSGVILVPFPVESAISGVMEHHDRLWYRRTFTVPPAWNGRRIVLNFGAVDYESEVYINGTSLGIHRGGYDPFSYDVTPYLVGSGAQELIVRVYDPTELGGQPRGKQTTAPEGIMYTPTSGIWQTLWLEPVATNGISSIKIVPNLDQSAVKISVNTTGSTSGVSIAIKVKDTGAVVATTNGNPNSEISVAIPSPKLWSPNNPFLYDLELSLVQSGNTNDTVTSYFGMRKVSVGTVDGAPKLMLNNQFVFQLGPLDQGFWPDGIYTAPTEDALKYDLQQMKALGFNAVRKHIKVEPYRWYYWADKLGLMVWQDMPSPNSYTNIHPAVDTVAFESELVRMVQTHWNSPCIVMWVLFNESQGQNNTQTLVQEVMNLDPSRPVNEASGDTHYGSGQVLDIHSYPAPNAPSSATQAMVCGEYGGIGLQINGHVWADSKGGYINVSNATDYANLYDSYANALVSLKTDKKLSAAIYTQTTDVESELNGIMTYDRAVVKTDIQKISASNYKVINQLLTVTDVLPTSQTQAQTWKYTAATPAANWYATNFSDAAWSSGPGGFGTAGTPNAVIGTTWNSSDIWLRKQFNPGTLTASDVSNLVFNVYHDEDCEIYINGVLAGSTPGFASGYVLLQFNQAGKNALVPNANNVIAVHCHQTAGGQAIDVGIVKMLFVDSNPTAPPTPSGLSATPGNAQVVLSWSLSLGATGYNLKRSTNSGAGYTTIAGNLSGTNYTDLVVSNGVTYYYVISATNSVGESANSSQVSATPVAPSSSLVAWFKADAITGVSNGAGLATWTDSSGNGNNATQSTAGLRPAYVTNAMNGLPVVRFNSTNNTYLAFNRVVQDDFTMLCVFRSTQGISTSTSFFNGAGLVNGEMPGVANDFGAALNANGQILAGVGNPDNTLVSSNGFNDGSPHVFTFKRTRSTGAIALYVDGVLAGSATGGTQSLTSPSRLVLGAQQTMLYYLTGDIAEVKIYNTPLADAGRQTEESALVNKYAIGLTLPSLMALHTNDAIQLTWPGGVAGYALWYITNITSSAWNQVTDTPVLLNSQWTVTLSIPNTQGARFYRLQKP